jgi:Ethanolamine utilization protein EutJ (predicted chaperonin)
MINDMLALEHEIVDLEAELARAYKLAKCERDGIVQDYERVLEEVRQRLETLKRIYENPNTDTDTLRNTVEYALQLLETL